MASGGMCGVFMNSCEHVYKGLGAWPFWFRMATRGVVYGERDVCGVFMNSREHV